MNLIKMNEEKKQRLIDRVIEVIKVNIEDGDVGPLDELLRSCPNSNLMAFLPDDEQHQYYETEKEILEFKKKWGQSHSEITANLDYPKNHSESDELLMIDYFWLDDTKQWYPKCSSIYSEREQEIADLLRIYA